MKILIYGINFSPERVGIGPYTAELVDFLSRRGHELRVVTAQPYFPGWRLHSGYLNRYEHAIWNGCHVWRCPLWVPRRPSGLKRLLHLASFALSSLGPLFRQAFWRPRLVLVVAPAFFCAPATLLFGRLCGSDTRLWLHLQDFELDAAFELGLLKGRLLRSLAEAWERRTLRGFDRVSSISSAMVQSLQLKGVAADRCALLPNWVDLDRIQPQLAAARSLNHYRRSLRIRDDQIVIMYSGSMNKKQGLEMLIDVINQLLDIAGLVWLFAGEGPTKAHLVSATEHFSHVHHLPLQPSELLNDWLNAADIHLLPQKAAAADLVLPSKLLGILASGRPVVASSPPGSELARLADSAGVCVPPGDPRAFAGALRGLIADPALRARAGLAARQLAEKCFSRCEVLQSLEQQLQDLVVSLPRPRH